MAHRRGSPFSGSGLPCSWDEASFPRRCTAAVSLLVSPAGGCLSNAPLQSGHMGAPDNQAAIQEAE
ncbi:hypothetical protein FQN60_001785 [Etheostoma spectabile]|uniref:Uncharacterized protein n=1 Tax=Etheostoma spectabile TaxID=54343 RepID=A0A5J5D7X6_9PERO|nr:hypothetical protein FQN60_001785 [Etheostoma spectabile]